MSDKNTEIQQFLTERDDRSTTPIELEARGTPNMLDQDPELSQILSEDTNA